MTTRRNTLDKQGRLHDLFAEDLNEIKRERIALGKDEVNRPIGTKRITLALHRHKLFREIKEDIKKANFVPGDDEKVFP